MFRTSRFKQRASVVAAVAFTASLVLAGCASQQQAEGNSAKSGGKLYDAAVAEAKSIANGKKLDSSLEMIGNNSGAEGQTLQEVYKAFTEGAKVNVKYTGTSDVSSIVQSRLAAGNPPNVADIQPGIALQLAKEGKTVDLTAAFGDELKSNFDVALLDGVSYNGKVFGVFQGFSNFMFWYNPEAYSGPKDPTSWSQITDWTKEKAKAGTPVWCAAQNAGAQSGFPGAQFIENIFLKKYGPELYKKWGTGELAWTSPEVKDAWQEFGAIIGTDANVSGGVAGALSSPIATGYNGLTATPTSCQAILWGSWVPGLIGDTAKPGKTIDFFKIPATDPKYADDEMFQSTTSVGLKNNDTTKAFLKFMASDAAQRYLASLGRWPVADKNVEASTYPNVSLQKISKEFFGNSGTKLVVGPNSLANAATGAAFWKGVVSYLQNPSQLDSILQGIQATVK